MLPVPIKPMFVQWVSRVNDKLSRAAIVGPESDAMAPYAGARIPTITFELVEQFREPCGWFQLTQNVTPRRVPHGGSMTHARRELEILRVSVCLWLPAR